MKINYFKNFSLTSYIINYNINHSSLNVKIMQQNIKCHHYFLSLILQMRIVLNIIIVIIIVFTIFKTLSVIY